MASDVIRVRLRETRVLRVQVDTPSELVVEVESTVMRPRCPACGFGCARVHDTRRRDIRDVGVSGRRTTLVRHRRRFRCAPARSLASRKWKLEFTLHRLLLVLRDAAGSNVRVPPG